ncbi:aspartate dehydrogenase [Agrobacterium tumefaciens]|uniref:aspartate dehydrogenase n=1 Tax=Agrobacterium tumefaciens TaxID=358 RepID=UPI0004705476
MTQTETVCLVGWGAISQTVANMLEQRRSGAKIVAVAVRDTAKARPDLPQGAKLISSPEELVSTGARLVVEAAGRESVASFGRAALCANMDFAVSSTSAFVNEGLLTELTTLARNNGRQLILPPGALAGLDALSAASRLSLDRVEHRITKPPGAWIGTEAERLCNLHELKEATSIFVGSASQAASRFPQNANVAILSSLAGVGIEKTQVSLVADPKAALNSHVIYVEGSFGNLSINVSNRPLPANPKSSTMTALNIVRMIENRLPGLVI